MSSVLPCEFVPPPKQSYPQKSNSLPHYKNLALLWEQDHPDLSVYPRPEETSVRILDIEKDKAIVWMENSLFLEGMCLPSEMLR